MSINQSEINKPALIQENISLEEELIVCRDEYIREIKQELLGPGSELSYPDAEHEIITNPPQKRYSIGILFPQHNLVNADSDESMKIEESVDIDEADVEEVTAEQKENFKNDEGIKSKGNARPDEESMDEEIGLAMQSLPSSMGITFYAKGNVEIVNCEVKFATYLKTKIEECLIPYEVDNIDEYEIPFSLSQYFYYDKELKAIRPNQKVTKADIRRLRETAVDLEGEDRIFDPLYKLCDQIATGYKRLPHKASVNLDFTCSEYIDNNAKVDGADLKATALRRRLADNTYSITIMLVNTCNEKVVGDKCIFQPEILVNTFENNFIFVDARHKNLNLSEEEMISELLYRNKHAYGSGLGTSVSWNIDSNGQGSFYSDFFPEIEVPTIDFKLSSDYEIPQHCMSMKFFSDLNDKDKKTKITSLYELCDSYDAWINDQETTISSLQDQYLTQAQKNIQYCKKALQRMRAGVSLLEKNNIAWNAFQLANRSMFMQREHIVMQNRMANKDRFPADLEIQAELNGMDYNKCNDQHQWRPFQLAFLLIGVQSIVEEDSDSRDIVDLIWFPTGGGKTEAYLGLTAFTIFFRKISKTEQQAGTFVIMRYTLRLLAAQQFTRAATLICACEYIRRDCNKTNSKYVRYELGNDPISIGLWIGGDHTPNSNNNAKSLLLKLTDANAHSLLWENERNNKFQVLKCPWCGTKLVKEAIDYKLIGQWGYKMKNNSSFYMSCTHEACTFNDILPVQIVDEELYKKPPTLLFGTVDKFAMLPWKYSAGSFFGDGKKQKGPDLIIQDELHLISGPLGTLVGLYETAIDFLCQKRGIKPKIVASTATIKNAKEQCAALYNRSVYQFPPPGIDADDSYFAREAEINYQEKKFGRKYIGIMPSGKTKAMMEVRTIAALLQKVKSMDMSDEAKDKLWTLTIYFNSLRDLGKCATLIDDDVKDFIKRMVFRLGNSRDARMITTVDELTSRVSTTELNATLDKLEKLSYSKDNIANKQYASNVLLATNMISVGIDVERLNVMLMVGQPKLTSEYIQASSRIGRKYPGVALVLLDSSKSRDRSHYEQFKAFNESYYRFVEPTGVTPFSKPARQRALHAVVITILRHMDIGLSEEGDAGRFSVAQYKQEIERAESFIMSRVKSISNLSDLNYLEEMQDISAEIDYFLAEWDKMAQTYGSEKLYYGERFMFKQPSPEEARLMKSYNTSQTDTASFDTMTSMRNVDCSVGGNILIWRKENDNNPS